MKSPSPPTWPRLVFVLFTAGLLYLALTAADLYSLRAFARTEAPAGNTVSAQPVAYVPLGSTSAPQAGGDALSPTDCNVAEVGDGGDLGQRVSRLLGQYQPLLTARIKEDTAYVALGPALQQLGGELRWKPGDTQGAILLPHALVTFTIGQTTAYRNHRPVELGAPPRAEYGQIRLPVRTLGPLCGMGVELVDTANQGLYRLTHGEQTAHVLVRERMYRLEASRSGRWLQVYFLGQPVKRYPICAGEGNNTPVGNFHISNKAVWPPWNAYWGEYMPGGSARNPLGARWLGTTAHGRATGRVIGIHGTNQPSSIGRRISGGCMRCYNHHAIELFNNIPVGTPLWVHE